MKTKSELDGNIERSAETTDLSPILDVNNTPIDPIWAAEFRGFFWGEGTLSVQCHRPAGRGMKESYSTSITASIGLRSDDAAILQVFQSRLGGKLRTEQYRDGSGKTITRWVVGTAADCQRIGRLLLSPTASPFNKARQLDLWMQAVEVKLGAGAHSGSRYRQADHDFLEMAWQELMRLRKWTG